MSLLIGSIRPTKVEVNGVLVDKAAVFVHASTGGVEIASEPSLSIDPEEARAYSAHLSRAAETCERMRMRNSALGAAAAAVVRELRGLSASMPSSVQVALRLLDDELGRYGGPR